MYTYKIKSLPKKTIEITLESPWADIEAEYEIAFESLRSNLQIEGFRKGKAPITVASKHIPKNDVYQKLLQTYISRVYSEIVKKESIKPLVPPKVDVLNAKEKETWKLVIATAEVPEVELGKYKDRIIEAKKNLKTAEIWVPGKDKAEPTEADKEKLNQQKFTAVLEALMKEAKVEISDLIIEEDVSRRLTKLVDDIQKVGLTMESYLKSKSLTKDQLHDQIAKEISETYKVEFILQHIADKENIKVEQSDIEKMIAGVKDEKEKETVRKNAYYYASVLRKQKTLDYLNSL